jgi:hypothetical protein
MNPKTLLLGFALFTSCARTDFYYPSNGKDVVVDERGRPHRAHGRAIVLNGSDSLGATHVRITSNSLEFSNQGGIDNSTSTREGYRTVRHGVTAGALTAVGVVGLQEAGAAYSANQATTRASNAAASKASAAAASRALPAGGSTIRAVVPATVVPVP